MDSPKNKIANQLFVSVNSLLKSLAHIIHKFQTTRPGIRRDIVFERIFLSDIPTACICEFKRQKPSELARLQADERE